MEEVQLGTHSVGRDFGIKSVDAHTRGLWVDDSDFTRPLAFGFPSAFTGFRGRLPQMADGSGVSLVLTLSGLGPGIPVFQLHRVKMLHRGHVKAAATLYFP